MPDAAFVDQDGKPRDFASFRGSAVVVTFIYTKCPMPTFCPLMDRHFAAMQAKLKSDPALKRVHLVSVSFDPTTDTPPVLKKHAATLGADPSRWTFLTGDRDDIDQFAARFGVAVTREMNDPTNITHNLRTAIIDARGNLVKTYTGNEWTPEQVLADLCRRCRRRTDRAGLVRPRLGPIERPPREAFTARERRLIARLRTPAAGPALSERAAPTTASRRRPARRCAASAASSGTAARIASKRRCSPRSSSNSTAIRRWSSASSRSTSSITCSSSTAAADAGDRSRGRAIPGCTGGKPVFATPRALALSYVDPYVDYTGRVTGYAVVDLRVMGALRLAAGGDERLEGRADAARLSRIARIETSDARIKRLRAWYRAYRAEHGRKPVDYKHRERWTELPRSSSREGDVTRGRGDVAV